MKTKKSELLEEYNTIEKVGVIGRIANMLTKYGYKKIISSLIIFMLFITTIIIYTNQKEIVKKIITEQKQEEQQKEQQKNIDKLRFRVTEVNPRAEAILYKLLAQTKADRSFVFEMHNGTDNPTGLPFIYADMTYENMSNDSLSSIISNYEKINLSRLSIATYLMKYKEFTGTVDELKKIDNRTGSDLKYSNVKFISAYTIRTINSEIGFVGVVFYDNEEVDINKIESNMIDASQKLSILLDITNNIKDD